MKGRNLFQQESTWCRLTHSTEIPGGIQTNKLGGRERRGECQTVAEYHLGCRRDLLTACQELNSLLFLSFSATFVSAPVPPLLSSFSPHDLFSPPYFRCRVRGGGGVVGDETCLGLCSINRAGRGAVIIRRLKNLLFGTAASPGAVIRAGEMRKARVGALHWLTMPARLCRRCR